MSNESYKPKPVPEDHALYTAGLLGASKRMHSAMRCALVGGERVHPEHMRDFNIPWFLETKQDPDVELEDYGADTEKKLKAALLSHGHKESDIRQNARVITHWAFNLLRTGIGLNKKCHLEGGKACTPEDVLERTRHLILLLAKHGADRPIIASTPAHPLWNPHRGHMREMQGVPKCILKGTAAEHRFARSLIGTSINIERTTDSPMSQISREAVPQLFEPNYRHITELAYERRKNLRKLLEGKSVFTDDLRQAAVDQIADMWLEINPTNAEVLDALEVRLREGGPSIMDGNTRDILMHYFNPLFGTKETDIAEVQHRLPILGSVTLRSVLDDDQEGIADCISTLELLSFMNEKKYSRTIQLAILACMPRLPGMSPQRVVDNLQ